MPLQTLISMLKISSPVPINPAVSHLCVSASPGLRDTGCTGGCTNQSCPKTNPFAQGMNSRENNHSMCSDRGCSLLISASLEREQGNKAGKCRKISKRLLVKISSVLLSATPFSPEVLRDTRPTSQGRPV